MAIGSNVNGVRSDDGTWRLFVGGDGIKKLALGGTLRFDDTVWDDLRITSGGFEFPGTADPAAVNFQPGGTGPVFKLYEFAKNDVIQVVAQMPHGYKAGTALRVHVHWTPGAYGVAQRGNAVGWKADITMAGYGEAFSTGTTYDLSEAVPTDAADYEHIISPSATVDPPAGFSESGMIIMNIYRSDTGTDDTWTETLSGRLPMLLEVDIHYQLDKLGSDDEVPS